jgi:hypothetical protein
MKEGGRKRKEEARKRKEEARKTKEEARKRKEEAGKRNGGGRKEEGESKGSVRAVSRKSKQHAVGQLPVSWIMVSLQLINCSPNEVAGQG